MLHKSIRYGTPIINYSYSVKRFATLLSDLTSKAKLTKFNLNSFKPHNCITNGTLESNRRFHQANCCTASSAFSCLYLRAPPFTANIYTPLLRHLCYQQQLSAVYTVSQRNLHLRPQTLFGITMGSINCKEYVTTSDARACQTENGTTGSGSYQSTCESQMAEKLTNPVAVCNINDLCENEMKQFDFDENTKVLVIRQRDHIVAIGNKCTHYGAPLHTGVLGDGRVRCPWHGACFNIETGDIEDFPGLDSLPCFKVDVKAGGQVMLRARVKDIENSRRLKDMCKRDLSNPLCYIVVGGGPAGAVCVETLRQEGFTGRLVMICKEDHLPYDRVKLSKASDIQIETIQFRKQEFYDEYGIEAILDVEATKMDCYEKTLSLSNGWVLKYDKVFIATGSTPRKPPIKGSDLKGVMVLRQYEDVKNINKIVNSETNMVCLGSSFIAMEAAQTWAKKVKSITVVSRSEFPFMDSLGRDIGERILRLFRDQGVNMIMSSGIVEIIGDNNKRVTEVVLSDGTKLPCNVLIMGTGSKLNTEFLIGSGLPVNHNGSIETDMYLRTLIEDVYVGGDIANAPLFSINNQRATIGHYQLAQYHGRIAAINMADKSRQELRAVPFFFTMLFGKGIRYSGYGLYTDVLIEGDLENLKFVAYFIDDNDIVVAVASCGRDPIVSQFAELKSQGRQLCRKELENPCGWAMKLKAPTKCF